MFKTAEELKRDYTLENKTEGASKSHVADKVRTAFPNALTNTEFVYHVTKVLADYGYSNENTLLATSFCCDKVNRPLEKLFSNHYSSNFSMGGLAGFPFGGLASFKEMAHHIPDGGSCLIIYGPHVGIDKEGNVSIQNAKGRSMLGACCESAISAYQHVQSVRSGVGSYKIDPLDFQQSMVSKILAPYADRLEKVSNPRIDLPHCLYESQKKMIREIVDAGVGEVLEMETKIAIVGGIQINTAHEGLDFFLPLDFEIRSSDNATIAKLLDFM